MLTEEQKANEVRQCLRHAFLACCNYTEDAREYVDEAENQDGLAYWDYFATLDAVLEDFQLYLEMIDEPQTS